jgi:hypothetical protein
MENERIVLAVEAMEREVNNGGYLQFFSNSSIEFTPILVKSLQRIHCPKTAQLTQQAINVLGLTGAVTIENIDKAIRGDNKQSDEQLIECDRKYYQNEEDIAGQLFIFLKNNQIKINL